MTLVKNNSETTRALSDGKQLYHIQSITDWHEDPFDLFVFSESEPSRAQIRKLFIEELQINDGEDTPEGEITDLVNNAEVYSVYAETI